MGDFWLIINLILINNFIISTANIHNYFKNASLKTFYGLFTDFLRSYYVVVILYLTITHIFASGVVRGGAEPQPLAAVSRRLGQVSGWGGAWVGRAGVLGFGSLRWLEGWKRSKPKAQPVCGWVRWGAVGLAGVFGFGSLRWKVRWKMSKPKAQP